MFTRQNRQEVKVRLDGITRRVLEKNDEIWNGDYVISYAGVKQAVEENIWHRLLRATILKHPQWKWPLWIREQSDVENPGYSSGYASNQAYRSFSMIGTSEGEWEPVVGLDGSIMPRAGAYALTFWLYLNGELIAVGEKGKLNQEKKEGYLPIIETTWTLPEVRIKLISFADNVVGKDVCFTRIQLTNLSKRANSISLFAVITPWGPEEFHPVSEIQYDDKLYTFIVENKLAVIFEDKPASYSCSDYETGYICVDALDGKLENNSGCKCPLGFASGSVCFPVSLAPHEEKNLDMKLLIDLVDPNSQLVVDIKNAEINAHLRKVEEYWKDKLKEGIDIQIPDDLAMETYKSILIDLLLLRDGENITPGPTMYHGDWIRDRAHLLYALEMAGFHKEVHKCMSYFKKAQGPEGYFWHSTVALLKDDKNLRELDSFGEAVWSMVQHYRFGKNKEWLQEVYPLIKKGTEFIRNIRSQTKVLEEGEKPLHYGLLPKSWSAEHLGPPDYIYYDDFWAVCGLKSAIFAAQELGMNEDIKWMREERADLETCLWDSVERTIEKRGLPCLPVSPYQDISSTIQGNIAALWPCEIVKSDNKRIDEVLEVLYSRHMPNHCLFHPIFGSYLPLFTWSIANCFVHKRDKEKVSKILKWTLKNGQTSTHAQAEGVHPKTLYGGEGDGVSGWSEGEYFMLLRNMLLLEQDESLWIAPCLLEEWLSENSPIKVKNAPTSFGRLGFSLTPHWSKNYVDIEMNFKGDLPKKGFVLFIDHPEGKAIKRVEVDGEDWQQFKSNQVDISRLFEKVKVFFE
jgi:hypothetical protein